MSQLLRVGAAIVLISRATRIMAVSTAADLNHLQSSSHPAPLGPSHRPQILAPRVLVVGCTSIHEIELTSNDPENPTGDARRAYQLEYVDKGGSGCVYNIVGGWSDKPALAKFIGRKVPMGELYALEKLNELYHAENVENPVAFEGWWLVMVKHEGNRLHEIDVWIGRFRGQNYLGVDALQKDIDECDKLLDKIHNLVITTIVRYAEEKGLLHQDYHYGNILFVGLTSVILIDWGRYKLHPVGQPLAPDVVNEIRHLVTHFQIPKRDAHSTWPGQPQGSIYTFQGVCQSAKRWEGHQPTSPFDQPNIISDRSYFSSFNE